MIAMYSGFTVQYTVNVYMYMLTTQVVSKSDVNSGVKVRKMTGWSASSIGTENMGLYMSSQELESLLV